MSSFSTVHLVAWIFFICIETSTSNIDTRELTNQQVELHPKSQGEFPDILPVFLKSPDRILKFNFIKKEVNYNLPVYTRTKDAKDVLLDTPPITNAAFYKDDRYDASVTLRCEENDPLYNMVNSCNERLMVSNRYDASVTLRCEENDPLYNMANSCKERLMSGFFYLDGYKHVIEPKRRITKRFVKDINPNPPNEFIQRHQVFKIHEQNYSCGVTDDIKPFKNILNSNVITGNDRIKRTKTKIIIEVMVLFTHTMPINEEEIRLMKIYYIHVFYGVNALYNNIDLKDMSFGVDLIGFILEPNDTPLYVFPNGQKSLGYLDTNKTIHALANFKAKYKHPCDHLTMFSKYNISKTHYYIGKAELGKLCQDFSVSLIRDLSNFKEIDIVAHSLGHSLGGYDDSVRNQCPADKTEGYIMSALLRITLSKQHMQNRYKFSNCSLKYITDFIKSLNPNCLLTKTKPPIVPVIPTGQLYSVREQCKARANLQKLCWHTYTRNISTLCLRIYCDTGRGRCDRILPAYKTTCGNKKWCVYGECVYDIKAPLADESCLFGDDEDITVQLVNGTKYQTKKCTELINLLPGFCHNSTDKRKCCDTCFQLAHPGNRMTTPLWPQSLMSSTVPAAAANLKGQLFPVALAVLHLLLLESYLRTLN